MTEEQAINFNKWLLNRPKRKFKVCGKCEHFTEVSSSKSAFCYQENEEFPTLLTVWEDVQIPWMNKCPFEMEIMVLNQ